MRFSAPHRRRQVFSFFDVRSSFSRFSDFIEASRVKKYVQFCDKLFKFHFNAEYITDYDLYLILIDVSHPIWVGAQL